MIICVEGLDGVGKSSLVNNLSNSLCIKTISKPIDSLLLHDKESSHKVMENIYNYSNNLVAMYYLMGNLSALEDGRKEDVILDRGFLSTYYFSCHDDNRELFDFYASHYGFPDITIVLYASIEERIKRITHRNSKDLDLGKKRIYVDGYDKIFEAIRRYNIPHVIINTDNLSEEETHKKVMEILREFMKNKSVIEQYSIDQMTMKLERRDNNEGNNC